MQNRVYETPVWDVANLRQRFVAILGMTYRKALWTILLMIGACVNEKGGHFEHLL